jgi:hypothetical protein
MLDLDSGVRPGVRVFLFFFFFFSHFFSFEWQQDLARFGYGPDLHFKIPFYREPLGSLKEPTVFWAVIF